MIAVVLVERSEKPFVAISRSCPIDQVPAAFKEAMPALMLAVQAQGLEPVMPPMCRFLTWDTKANLAELQIGVRVAKPVTVAEPLVSGMLPRGTWAVAWHEGPYATLAKTHAAIAEFVGHQDQVRRAGPPVEFYWSDPQEHPDPATLRTEVCFPVLQISDSVPAS